MLSPLDSINHEYATFSKLKTAHSLLWYQLQIAHIRGLQCVSIKMQQSH